MSTDSDRFSSYIIDMDTLAARRLNMIDFIEERTGRMPDWLDLLFMVNDHGGSGVGLGAISDAVMSEVVSLHIHLENLAKRPEILKSYIEKGMKGIGGGK